MKRRYWTPAERNKVLSEYGLKTSAQIAAEIGRTAWSVRSYIKRINDERKWSRNESLENINRAIRGAGRINSAANRR